MDRVWVHRPDTAFWGLTFAIPVAVGIVFARVNLVAEGFGYEIANAESAFYILVGIVFLLVAVLYLWASYAISVKRLHDRDHSGWWVVAPTALFLLADLTWSLGEAPQRASALPVAIGLIGFGVGIWLFVEVGFLRGTQGPNRYGPDPLGQTQADAAL